MKLANPSKLSLEADPDAFLKCARSKAMLWHLLERLFSGEEIAEDELESWGLKIALVDEYVAVPRLSDAPR